MYIIYSSLLYLHTTQYSSNTTTIAPMTCRLNSSSTTWYETNWTELPIFLKIIIIWLSCWSILWCDTAINNIPTRRKKKIIINNKKITTTTTKNYYYIIIILKYRSLHFVVVRVKHFTNSAFRMNRFLRWDGIWKDVTGGKLRCFAW